MYQTQDISLVLASRLEEAALRAERLAQSLGVKVTEQDVPDALRLIVLDDALELRGPASVSRRGVAVDFTSIGLQRIGSARRHPLGKAIGRDSSRVLDATAGMGQDAFLLACFGYDVLAVERSPIVAALLDDGLRRINQDEAYHAAIGKRLHIVHGEARDVLQHADPPPDAVYIDPMFPPKRRASALPRKEIQLLRQVVGDDEDADAVLETARSMVDRVVVKRPTHAPPLAPEPSHCIESKLVRYDVYLQQAR